MAVTINGTTGIETNTDTGKIKVGASDDLTIEHSDTGNLSSITHSGAGKFDIVSTGDDLNIKSSENVVLMTNDTEIGVYVIKNGTVKLYHDNTEQCSTSANGLAFPSGKGIDFSATADGGGTSTTQELLDDYEEGTWTPVDASGGSVSYTDTAGNCKYTKIGRTVIASFTVTFLSTSNAAQARIGGLPYACVGTTNNNASVAIGEHNDLHQATMVVNQGQSYMLVLMCSSGVSVRANNECSGKNYRGTAIYQTA